MAINRIAAAACSCTLLLALTIVLGRGPDAVKFGGLEHDADSLRQTLEVTVLPVEVPAGLEGGDNMQFKVGSSVYAARIPLGLTAGQTFKVSLGGVPTEEQLAAPPTVQVRVSDNHMIYVYYSIKQTDD